MPLAPDDMRQKLDNVISILDKVGSNFGAYKSRAHSLPLTLALTLRENKSSMLLFLRARLLTRRALTYRAC